MVNDIQKVVKNPSPGRSLKKKKRVAGKLGEGILHLMLLPGTLFLLIFSYLPMYGVVIAFQRYNIAKGIFGGQRWVGWYNFTYVFNLPDFKQAFINTFVIAVSKVIVDLAVPLLVALLLNEIASNKIKRSVQTLIYLPHFLSWVILAGIITTILSPKSGMVNMAIQALGFEPIFFLGDNKWFPFTIVSTHVWKEFGWGTIIYLAAITGIDMELYEAAKMDGANRFQQTIFVTVPGMNHIIIMMMVLSLGKVLNAGFDQIFNLYSPLVYQSGDVIETLTYRIGLVQANFGVSTAIGLFKSVVSMVLIIVSRFIAYKTTGYRVF